MTRAALALVLAMSTFAGHAHAEWKGKHLEGVVASVAGKPILLSEVRLRVRLEHTQGSGAGMPTEGEVVERIIKERLIAADMKSVRVEITREEIDAAFAAVVKGQGLNAQRQPVTAAELRASLAQLGWTEATFRDALARQLLDVKWLNLRIVPSLKPGMKQGDVVDEALKALEKKYAVERELL